VTKTLGERIEMWPWSKTVIVVGIITFVLSQLVAALMSVAVILVPALQPSPSQAWIVDRMVRVFEIVQEGSLWAMGIGGGTLGIKRATTKADVIDAQTRAAQSGVGTTTVDGVQQLNNKPGEDPDKGEVTDASRITD
jgi:hypothetical protein